MQRTAIVSAAAILSSLAAGAALAPSIAFAQEEAAADGSPTSAESTAPEGETAPADDPANENLAAELTRRHQLQQTYTVRRKVDGEVIETEERTVPFADGRPILPTEAGRTIEARLKASFDRGLLTRTEALEEAKVDFALGDVDRNGAIDAPEFTRLLDILQEHDDALERADEATGRKKFVASLEDAESPAEDPAASFAAFAGADAGALDERAFILAFLRQFDEADANGDALLSGDELGRFRDRFGE